MDRSGRSLLTTPNPRRPVQPLPAVPIHLPTASGTLRAVERLPRSAPSVWLGSISEIAGWFGSCSAIDAAGSGCDIVWSNCNSVGGTVGKAEESGCTLVPTEIVFRALAAALEQERTALVWCSCHRRPTGIIDCLQEIGLPRARAWRQRLAAIRSVRLSAPAHGAKQPLRHPHH